MHALALALALTLTQTADAAGAARDIDGEAVQIDDQTILAFFDTRCTDCAVTLQAAQRLRDWAGVDVVAVSTDPSADRPRIRPWMSRRGLAMRVVHDQSGALQRRYAAHSGQTVVAREGGPSERAVAPTRADVVQRTAILAALVGADTPVLLEVASVPTW